MVKQTDFNCANLLCCTAVVIMLTCTSCKLYNLNVESPSHFIGVINEHINKVAIIREIANYINSFNLGCSN